MIVHVCDRRHPAPDAGAAARPPEEELTARTANLVLRRSSDGYTVFHETDGYGITGVTVQFADGTQSCSFDGRPPLGSDRPLAIEPRRPANAHCWIWTEGMDQARLTSRITRVVGHRLP